MLQGETLQGEMLHWVKCYRGWNVTGWNVTGRNVTGWNVFWVKRYSSSVSPPPQIRLHTWKHNMPPKGTVREALLLLIEGEEESSSTKGETRQLMSTWSILCDASSCYDIHLLSYLQWNLFWDMFLAWHLVVNLFCSDTYHFQFFIQHRVSNYAA